MLSTKKIRFLILALFLSIVTGGCVAKQLPPYMVSINSVYSDKLCTGAVIGPNEVMTANHCVEGNYLNRIVTINNMEYSFKVAYTDTVRDIAILHTRVPLFVTQYATTAPAKEGFATLYGLCPFHFPTALLVKYIANSTEAVFANGEKVTFAYDWWEGVQQRRPCGGDSGGFILQDGSIVGVTSAVDSEEYFVVIGRNVYTIPYSDFSEVVNASRQQRVAGSGK